VFQLIYPRMYIYIYRTGHGC